MSEPVHKPVLLQETIEFLQLSEGDVIVDGTVNEAGHSQVICQAIGRDGHLIGIDRDAEALREAEKNLTGAKCQVTLAEDNYRNMDKVVHRSGVDAVDGVLLDIGLSSRQLESTERGFTFQKKQPLVMTFESEPERSIHTAHTIVNEWEVESIEDILRGFGDERFAKRIAAAIEKARKEAPIDTTTQLADIITEAVPIWYRKGRTHPATKTFQALRIAVNDEFGALSEGIETGISLLRSGRRIAVISFHSGEDRIVKRAFRDAKEKGLVRIITNKPIVPNDDEVNENPRSRSSKLRVAEKV